MPKELDVEIKTPKLVGRQIHRENYSSSEPEPYYRKSIYIPVLDNMISDLEVRLSENTLELYNFSILYPDNKIDNREAIIKKFLQDHFRQIKSYLCK